MRALLDSIEKRFSLFAVYRERLAPGGCEIGRIKLASDESYALKYISPEACWEDDDLHYKFSDVTRVLFDGEYERTLALVAGIGAPEPPAAG